MREISAELIGKEITRLCIETNLKLPDDIRNAMEKARRTEPWPVAADTLQVLCDNMRAADERTLPVCQDTGMACVFLEIGQDVHITGDLKAAVNDAVAKGYTEGYLRKSVVKDPLRRVNTEDNTPAMLTIDLTPGDKVKITVAPKGFGSENMSRLKMLRPADGAEGVMDFVVETMKLAGSNPCPPVVLGVGIGGTFDKAALLAKHALLRPIDEHNPDEFYAEMERELLKRINALGTGPQGFGGRTTALGVNIETLPTHVAGLPVAVNVSCHVTRRASVEI